jgi:hypothetical protein
MNSFILLSTLLPLEAVAVPSVLPCCYCPEIVSDCLLYWWPSSISPVCPLPARGWKAVDSPKCLITQTQQPTRAKPSDAGFVGPEDKNKPQIIEIPHPLPVENQNTIEPAFVTPKGCYKGSKKTYATTIQVVFGEAQYDLKISGIVRRQFHAIPFTMNGQYILTNPTPELSTFLADKNMSLDDMEFEYIASRDVVVSRMRAATGLVEIEAKRC